jgi:CubicO group peptidase (beta-lactamase class C family)
MRPISILLALLSASPAMSRAQTFANPHARDSIGDVRTMYDGRLTPDAAVRTFRNIDRLFPSRVVARGRSTTPLPRTTTRLPATRRTAALQCSYWSAGSLSLPSYMARNRVSGLLILKNGHIVAERYALGSTSATRWMSMSMAKSITSTLIGIALHDGAIRSLDDSVTQYVPRLRGSAYDGVTIRQLLTMSSGVRWNETYTDPTSDRRRLLEAQIAQQPGAALELMAALPRAAEPGTRFNYSTGETVVAGEVVRGATGKSLAEFLSERLWQPLGMESDATWWLDSPNGHEIGGSGIAATLRDYGRFGLYILNGGVIDGRQTLPSDWAKEAGSPTRLRNGAVSDYGYMWWPSADSIRADKSGAMVAGSVNAGAFSAQGIFGQWIYINPREGVVIVQLSALTQPVGGERIPPEVCFAAYTRAVR